MVTAAIEYANIDFRPVLRATGDRPKKFMRGISMLFCCALSDEELNTKDRAIEKCIEKLALGKLDAMDKLYSLIKTDVYAFALTKCQNRDDAEDVMQDTFIQIYKYAKRYEAMGKPMAWIFTIVTNLSLRKIAIGSRTSAITDEMSEELADNKEFEIDVVNSEFLKELMGILTQEEQEIIVLHIVSGMKHREIADILDLSLSTVLSKYNRAIKKMKSYAKETENE